MPSIQPSFFTFPTKPARSQEQERLGLLGLLKPDGEVDVEAMRYFSRVFAGQLCAYLCAGSDAGEVTALAQAFSELAARQDYRHIYLLVSIQYDRMGQVLPDPVWWLADHPAAMGLFSLGFVEQLSTLSSTLQQEGGMPGGQADGGGTG